MKLKTSVICGLIGSSVMLFTQLVSLAVDIYEGYFESVYTFLRISMLIAWGLIGCFFIGLLKKTK